MNKDIYRRTATTVSLIRYHFVFCPYRRRKIFLIPGIEDRFKELVRDICAENDIEISAISPPLLLRVSFDQFFEESGRAGTQSGRTGYLRETDQRIHFCSSAGGIYPASLCPQSMDTILFCFDCRKCQCGDDTAICRNTEDQILKGGISICSQ